MDLGLNDRVAVVTGASKGIGLAITRTLAAEGANVVAGALSIDSLDGIDSVTGVAVNLAEPDGPSDLVNAAVEQFGRIDILVNNVGAVHIRLARSPSSRIPRTTTEPWP
jgi:NAD(P)-dependent dehydrogenase (short-subunit alcohol dehydrogenase family)